MCSRVRLQRAVRASPTTCFADRSSRFCSRTRSEVCISFFFAIYCVSVTICLCPLGVVCVVCCTIEADACARLTKLPRLATRSDLRSFLLVPVGRQLAHDPDRGVEPRGFQLQRHFEYAPLLCIVVRCCAARSSCVAVFRARLRGVLRVIELSCPSALQPCLLVPLCAWSATLQIGCCRRHAGVRVAVQEDRDQGRQERDAGWDEGQPGRGADPRSTCQNHHCPSDYCCPSGFARCPCWLTGLCSLWDHVWERCDAFPDALLACLVLQR